MNIGHGLIRYIDNARMVKNPEVAILMSTYNGSTYLSELLDSLLQQDYSRFRIVIRDDGSTDDTLSILADYAERDHRICVETGKNIGCTASFMSLLLSSKADITMFCDQDDIWLPQKVSTAVDALTKTGLEKPILFHTDLTVVDRQLNLISDSFMAQEGIRLPECYSLQILAVQNCVVGCTLAMTSAFVELVARDEYALTSAAMHDWWIALLATCKGQILYSSHSDILYRQHELNVSGAKRRALFARIRSQFSIQGIRKINVYRTRIARQAQAFLNKHGEEIGVENASILQKTAKLEPCFGFSSVLIAQMRGLRFQKTYMNISIVYTALVTQILNIKTD